MNKCMIAGMGGIGSFLVEYLDKLISTNQLDGWQFECYDNDTVEIKNILYQNFCSEDIDSLKTESLSYRYSHIHRYMHQKAGVHSIDRYNIVVLCVDNNVIRKEAWNNWKINNIPFIDARANGKTVGIFSSSTQDYLSTIEDTNDSSSCQHPYQIQKNEIEVGNIIISSILLQCILNYTRTKFLPNTFMYNF